MKVLWFSVTPSLYDEKIYGGWIASLERIIHEYKNIELAIAFEYESDEFKKTKNNTTYYPINIKKSIKDKIMEKYIKDYEWDRLKPKLIEIINDFQPDIIQCFGSEWPFGRIAEYTNIPVIIHMQGFCNIYNSCCDIAYSKVEWIRCNLLNPKSILSSLVNDKKKQFDNYAERYLMSINKYFMGRTEWDRNIVKNYSPMAKYYYCSEALRPEIYNSNIIWKYKDRNIKHLVTITQAGILKGNEMILRTAKILKDEFNYQFIWEVAGNINAFKIAEKKTGISHKSYNIKLLGMISANDVANKLATSDVYIHPAIIDNSPNSLCEAQVIGCPVIATNVGGIPGLVNDGISGLLYPYNEPHTLAFKIMNLCNNPDVMKKISYNERDIALERHNPEIIRNTLSNIYKDILEGKNE